ncbi:hypothetical protein HK097_002701, partial [Rhizophlyctis rosea]
MSRIRDRPRRAPPPDLSTLLGRINAVLDDNSSDTFNTSISNLDAQIQKEERGLRSLTSGGDRGKGSGDELVEERGRSRSGADSGFATSGRTSPTLFGARSTKPLQPIASTPVPNARQAETSTPYPPSNTTLQIPNLSISHIDDSLSMPTLDEAHFDRLGKRVTFSEMIMERTISSMGSSSYMGRLYQSCCLATVNFYQRDEKQAHQKIQYTITRRIEYRSPSSFSELYSPKSDLSQKAGDREKEQFADLSYDVPDMNTDRESLGNANSGVNGFQSHGGDAQPTFADHENENQENVPPSDGPLTPSRNELSQTPVTAIRIGKPREISHTPIRFGMAQDPKISFQGRDPFGSVPSPKSPMAAEFVIRSPFSRSGGTPKRDGSPPLRENRTPSKPGLQSIDEDRELIDDGVTPKPMRTTPAQRSVSPVPLKNRFAWEEEDGGGEERVEQGK